jgi:hypothetical protein
MNAEPLIAIVERLRRDRAPRLPVPDGSLGWTIPTKPVCTVEAGKYINKEGI